ncbi:MAG TPA: hypothetical protein PK147_11925 [Saprospiraceae bacterium]|nr:hypothetical protein [Saprospiraceae bacterium]HPQ22557.1 hypothetical protein [Saprospiraceae bacterium]HRX27852.1 hypothetical protein [Saprospiraceae bacterium]
MTNKKHTKTTNYKGPNDVKRVIMWAAIITVVLLAIMYYMYTNA